MACMKAFFQTEVGCPSLTYYVCDTIAELPAGGIIVGSLAITLEGPKIYIGINDTTWRELPKAAVSGYTDPANLGSGTPSATTYLRGDNAWVVPPGGSVVVFENRTADPVSPAVGECWLRTDL